MKYECHITCYLHDAETCERVAKEHGWKTSEIARDPVLGDKTYFYLTCHSSGLAFLTDKMHAAVDLLRKAGVHPVRAKIEETIHDEYFNARRTIHNPN